MLTETIMDTFTSILEVVLIVVLPVAAAYGGKMLKDYITAYSRKVNNEYLRNMFDGIANTLESVVNSTSQTYVDVLKDKGEFGAAAQKEALEMSVNNAKTLLNKEAVDLIQKTHGDLDLWLKTQVESFVRDQGLIVMRQADKDSRDTIKVTGKSEKTTQRKRSDTKKK